MLALRPLGTHLPTSHHERVGKTTSLRPAAAERHIDDRALAAALRTSHLHTVDRKLDREKLVSAVLRGDGDAGAIRGGDRIHPRQADRRLDNAALRIGVDDLCRSPAPVEVIPDFVGAVGETHHFRV